MSLGWVFGFAVAGSAVFSIYSDYRIVKEVEIAPVQVFDAVCDVNGQKFEGKADLKAIWKRSNQFVYPAPSIETVVFKNANGVEMSFPDSASCDYKLSVSSKKMGTPPNPK